MSDKSYVTMEQRRCFICGKDFDTGTILLDKRLRPCFKRKTVTGNGVCQEHQKQINDGYIILIGSTDARGENRTGDIIAIREHTFKNVFNVPVPEKKIAFIEPGVVKLIKEIANGNGNIPPHQEQGTATGQGSDSGDGSERTEGSSGVGNGQVPPKGQLLQAHGPSEISGEVEFTATSPSVQRDST